MNKLILFKSIIASLAITVIGFCIPYDENNVIKNETTGIEVDSKEFLKEYSENHNNADKKYLYQTVLVKGEINSCTAFSRGLNIELNAGNELETVTCSLDYDQINSETNLNRGQKVFIKGRCGGYRFKEWLGLKNISIVECTLQQNWDQTNMLK